MTNTEKALTQVVGFGCEAFVKRAVEGGYKGPGIATDGSWYGQSVLLLPDVWIAVGNVEGWRPKVYFNRFVDALWELSTT